MIRGLDYSWGRPNLAQVKQQGYGFVVRYVGYSDGGKFISKPEADSIRASGLALVLVFEEGEDRALNGRATGRSDGSIALQKANAVGYPSNWPIFTAVDWDASPEQQGAIDEYLRGFAEYVGDRTGVYGSYWVCKRCKENGTAKWLWQTYAWSGGNRLPERHLYQHLNGQNVAAAEVDLNEAYGDLEQLIVGGDMITKTDIGPLRIANSEIGGWEMPGTHSGKYDTDFINAWQGRDFRDLINGLWQDGASWRNYRSAAIDFYNIWKDKVGGIGEDDEAQIKEALTTLQDAAAKVEAAKKKLDEAVND